MRYLVTKELKTPLYWRILRLLKLKKPRVEFFINLIGTYYTPGETFFYEWDEIKIINKCKQREI